MRYVIYNFILISFLFLVAQIGYSAEYIYPVASINNGKKILLIYQQSLSHIELWFWNPKTKQAEQGLWSLFDPAGLQMLPDSSGFSFIDKGRLRIQSFSKRSPKSIDLYEPLYNLSIINWIDKDVCYVSAKRENNYSIFQLHIDGIIDCLVSQENCDCLYPQKIGNKLFYIERSRQQSKDFDSSFMYRVMMTRYPNVMYDIIDFEQEKKNIIISTSIQHNELYNFDDTPIIFLTMISKNKGFVLEHPKIIDSKNKIICFTYHTIVKNNGHWLKKELFSFSIPSSLLLNESPDRLYESLLPLLPRIYNNIIYFADCSDNEKNNLELYSYDNKTGCITKKICTSTAQQHFFVPFQSEGSLLVGGTLKNENESVLIRRWIDDIKGLCLNLVKF